MTKTLNIFGNKVKVKLKDLTGMGIYGYYSIPEKTIYINSKLDKEDQRATLGHEIFHAMSHAIGLNQVISADTEEIIAENCQKLFFEVFDVRIRAPKKK